MYIIGETLMKNRFMRWIKAAGIRAIKTVAQTAVGMLSGEMMGIMEVDWLAVLSVAATAGIVSLFTSIAGLPELAKPEAREYGNVKD